MRQLTKEDILACDTFDRIVKHAATCSELITGRICTPSRTARLAVIARLIKANLEPVGNVLIAGRVAPREVAVPSRFTYLEVGILHGGTLAFIKAMTGAGVYIGIDDFSLSNGFDQTSGVPVSIEIADRNVRYFGGMQGKFIILEDDSQKPETVARFKLLCPEPPNLIFLDADHERPSVEKDFALWSPIAGPGTVFVFDDYNNPRCQGLTNFVNELDKTGWNDIGVIAEGECSYVLQKI